jgi:hypothetical protein
MASVHAPTIDTPICGSPGLSLLQRDRRQCQRFPIIAQAEYVLDGNRGSATTVDIGTGGVLLKTGKTLRCGQPIEVLINWPVLLEERLPLRLVVFGKVLRSNGAGTAVGIMRYEFRIRARSVARLSA